MSCFAVGLGYTCLLTGLFLWGSGVSEMRFDKISGCGLTGKAGSSGRRTEDPGTISSPLIFLAPLSFCLLVISRSPAASTSGECSLYFPICARASPLLSSDDATTYTHIHITHIEKFLN